MKFVAPIRKTATLRPIYTTQAQENSLYRLYASVVNVWNNPAIVAAYQKTLGEMTRDSVPEIEIAIDRTADNAVRAIFDFKWLFQGWFTDLMAWHAEKFSSALKYATGVDLRTVIGPIPTDTVEAVIARNVALVRNVSDQTRQKISDVVFRALTTRTPPKELAKEISAILGGQKARARRIASDQLSKMSSAMDTSRANDLGLTEWEWKHSEKVNFRPWHKARNGKIYDDRKLPADVKNDQPGFAPFCGCKKKYRIGGDQEEVTPPKPIAKAAPRAVPPPPTPPKPKQPTIAERDTEARKYVLEKGRAEGVEHLVAFDRATGKEITRHTSGKLGNVELGKALEEAIKDASGDVIVHHNHPGSSSFSRADLHLLNYYPGLRKVFAHGHDGTKYEATSTAPPHSNFPYLYQLAEDEFVGHMLKAASSGEITSIQMSKSRAHFVSRLLHDAGLIDYAVIPSASNADVWEKVEPIFERSRAEIAEKIRKKL